MKHKAFTLVELLVVIAIIAVLAAFLSPMLWGSHHQRHYQLSAERRNCASNLRHLGLAFRVYTVDNGDKFPPQSVRYDGWVSLISPYIRDSRVFSCPSTAREGSTDYFFNARLAQVKRAQITIRKKVILSGDGNDVGWPSAYLDKLPASWRLTENSPARRHFDTANYLFADGHVQSFKPNQITLDKPAAGHPTFLLGP